MPTSVFSEPVKSAFDEAANQAGADEAHRIKVTIDQQEVEIQTPYPSPADWRDQVIYFLMVDRFNNPATPPKHKPFNGEHNAFQGGSLEGVRQQLGYIKALGARAIWLTPVLKNTQYEDTTYHGYGIQDLLTVEPRFASNPEAAKANPELAEKELRSLVDEAHARGLYVIFDIVLNHTGTYSATTSARSATTKPRPTFATSHSTSIGTMSVAAPPSLISARHLKTYPATPRSGRGSCTATPFFAAKAKAAKAVATSSRSRSTSRVERESARS